jgi:branched-chain amino acid transport system permease protein
MSYVLSFLLVLQIQMLLAMSLNMVLGYSGMISMSHAAFMGLGAYAAALLAINLEVNILWGFLLAIVLSGIVAAIYGWVTMRLEGDTYILVSFSFQMVALELMMRWSSLTKGVLGLRGIPRPEVFGVALTGLPGYFALVTAISLPVAAFMIYLGRSQFGLAIRGIREGARAMESLGRDTLRMKVVNFAVAGAVAGLAGGMYASFLRFTHPGDYNLGVSILLLTYVLVGGIGNAWGAIAGTAVLVLMPQVLGFIPSIPNSLEGPLQAMLYGVVLMLVIWFKPAGLIPERPVVLAGKGGAQ